MKAVVTGATSFIGRAVIRELEDAGNEVIALRHSFEGERLPAQADVWLHFAWGGIGSGGRSNIAVQNENVRMSVDALSMAMRLGCEKFIFAGSQAEYGGVHTKHDDGLQHEGDICRPVSEYGRAKLEFGRRASEACLRNSAEGFVDTEYIHLRYFSVYGPGDHEGSLVNTAIRAFKDGRALELGPCTQRWNYMYIDDAAKATAAVMLRGSSGIYNIASAVSRPLMDYLTEAKRLLSGRSELLFGARENNAEGASPLCPSTDRLRSLGFEEQTDFAAGILKTAAFLETEK